MNKLDSNVNLNNESISGKLVPDVTFNSNGGGHNQNPFANGIGSLMKKKSSSKSKSILDDNIKDSLKEEEESGVFDSERIHDLNSNALNIDTIQFRMEDQKKDKYVFTSPKPNIQIIEEEKNSSHNDSKNGSFKIKAKVDSTVSNKIRPVPFKSEMELEKYSVNKTGSFNYDQVNHHKTENIKRRESNLDNFIFNVKGTEMVPLSVFDSNNTFNPNPKISILNSFTRRYNKTSIDQGKKFFKLRYVYEKYEEIVKLNSKNKDKEISEIPTTVVLNEDKNAIKLNSLFLQKLEKGIFSFNLKKYEDSYNYLLNTGIVKSVDEYGELLLVITGFDKYIIGDFLSKEKFPNKELKVLNAFIKSIDFKGVKYLNALRFLLGRLNLPKDAGLILGIVDTFSNFYYEDNKEAGNFPNPGCLYLLTSTVLALNTMFHKDIPNVNIIKKEGFINMNKEINSIILSAIYDEVKVNKLDIVHEYNELIYRRLSIKAKPGGNVDQFYETGQKLNFELGKNGEQHFNETSVDPSNDIKGEEVISMLKKGETFTKYGNFGQPHPRVIRLTVDEKRLEWFDKSSCNIFKKAKFIEVSEIKDVYIGASASKIFEKYHIPPDYDAHCFSIVTSKRSLDLRNNDENVCKKWYQAIKFVLKRTKSMSELKNNKNNMKDIINKKEIVSDFWKTEILPHWHIYRKFVIIKTKNLLDFSSINSLSNKKNKEKFAKIISQNSSKEGTTFLEEKDKSEFLYLWTLGVPDWLRKKLWSLVIGNESGITENLFNFHLKQVEEVNFDDLNKALCQPPNGNKVQPQSNSNTATIKPIKSKLHITEDPILNEMIHDIVKISNKYSFQIKESNIELNSFMMDLFKVVRVFTLFRPDITYSKQITYISTILLLNSENYYNAFISLVNFAIPSFIAKFLTRDEIYVNLLLIFI
jgi:hypothetical protein